MKKVNRNVYKKAVSAICVLLTMCMGLAGCTWEEDEVRVRLQREEEKDYTLEEVVVGDVAKTARIKFQLRKGEVTGTVELIIDNEIGTVYVKKGDIVKKGQLIRMLPCSVSEEEIEELEYRIARNTLLLGYVDMDETYALSERWWDYVYRSSGSDSDWENLQSSLESIRQSYRYKREDYEDAIELDTLRLEAAKKEIEENSIYAQADGVIESIGERIMNGNFHYFETLISTEGECVFDAPVIGYKDYFAEGEMIQMEVAQDNKRTMMNAIPYEMDKWEERKNLSFQVLTEDGRIAQRDTDLSAGATGMIYLTLDSREHVLCISSEAIHKADGKDYVYVLGENDIREVRWVEAGFKGDTKTEILSGLEEGEYVILR